MTEALEEKGFFDETAAFFDWRSQTQSFRERREKFVDVARTALHRAPANETPLCVDLGCGPGAISREVARLGFKTIGVDASPEMIKLAEQAAIDSGVSSTTFVRADLHEFLRSFDAQADFVMSSSVFEYLDDPVETISLVAPRLRKGALFAVSLPNRASLYRLVEPALLLRRPKAERYRREWRNSIGARALVRASEEFGFELETLSYFGQATVKGHAILPKLTHLGLIGTLSLVVLVKR